jgi:hypothetical protein
LLLSPLRLPQNRGEGLESAFKTAQGATIGVESSPLAVAQRNGAGEFSAEVNDLIRVARFVAARGAHWRTADPCASSAPIAARRDAEPKHRARWAVWISDCDWKATAL